MCCSFSPVPDSLASVTTCVAAKPNHGFFNCQHPGGTRRAPRRARRRAPGRRVGTADARHFASASRMHPRAAKKSACFMHSAMRDAPARGEAGLHDACPPRMPRHARSDVACVTVRFSFGTRFRHRGKRNARKCASPRRPARALQTKTPGVSPGVFGIEWRLRRRSPRPSAPRWSVVFAFDQFGVVVRRKQFVELVRLVDLDHEQPALAVGVLVDRLRLVGERAVDRDDGAGHR